MSCKGFKPQGPKKVQLPFAVPNAGVAGKSDAMRKQKFGKPPVPRAFKP